MQVMDIRVVRTPQGNGCMRLELNANYYTSLLSIIMHHYCEQYNRSTQHNIVEYLFATGP